MKLIFSGGEFGGMTGDFDVRVGEFITKAGFQYEVTDKTIEREDGVTNIAKYMDTA